MRIHIRNLLNPLNPPTNSFVAYQGFIEMGAEIVFFEDVNQIQAQQAGEIVVGHIADVKNALRNLGKKVPDEINYPESLSPFLGRKIWESTTNTIASQPEKWNIFIKPKYASKRFTGLVLRTTADLMGCGDALNDIPIWCSEIVNFVAEWRCFVRYGEILDVRPYKGDWRLHFDAKLIEAAVAAYQDAPASYGIDFGLTDKGETLLIEVNDGFSMGAYGLFPITYAKFLSARWAEMSNTSDFYNF